MKKKEYNIEPTEGQKRAADNIIQMKMAGKVNKGKALKEAGYGEYVQKNPKLVTESRGFKVYMAESGLTEASLAEMLAHDLLAKPTERLGEMKLAAELMGIKDNNVNVNIQRSDDNLESLAELVNSMRYDEDDEGGESEETSEDS